MMDTRTREVDLRLTEPYVGQDEIDAVAEQVKSGWLTPGNTVRRFESQFGDRMGQQHAVACNSGTSALILALEALDREGEYVVVPSFTCAPTVAAVLHAGYRPLFVGSEPSRLGMDPEQLAGVLEERPDVVAVMPVDVYGCEVDERVIEVAHRAEVPIVQDACESALPPYGTMACYSLRGDKMITAGGVGGMVVTPSEERAEGMRDARDHYLKPPFRYNTATGAGWGAQMSEMQAAFGLVQLTRLDGFIATRRKLAEAYQEMLPVNGVQAADRHVYWRYVVMVADPIEAMEILRRNGVEAMRAFKPLHEQPIGDSGLLFRDADFMVDDEMWDQGLCLPIGQHMTEEDVGRVAGILERFYWL